MGGRESSFCFEDIYEISITVLVKHFNEGKTVEESKINFFRNFIDEMRLTFGRKGSIRVVGRLRTNVVEPEHHFLSKACHVYSQETYEKLEDGLTKENLMEKSLELVKRRFSQKYVEMFCLRFFDGEAYLSIGKKFSVSESRVCQIVGEMTRFLRDAPEMAEYA